MNWTLPGKTEADHQLVYSYGLGDMLRRWFRRNRWKKGN